MPTNRRRRGHRLREQLTDAQLWGLILGGDCVPEDCEKCPLGIGETCLRRQEHNFAFESERHRRELWRIHHDELVALAGDGKVWAQDQYGG